MLVEKEQPIRKSPLEIMRLKASYTKVFGEAKNYMSYIK
jgi:hypothetical protein